MVELELWVEKYRPRRLDEVCGQREVIAALKGFVSRGTIPHLLFAGPPGTGKTTVALCLANELFGEEHAAENYLELNASDERGIDTIRTRVKNFARTASVSGASFKIIHLDESDNLTADAQQALRRMMELYSSTCRFILACNYLSKIIPPIQSRCAIFRFTRMSIDDMVGRLAYISKQEGFDVSRDVLEEIAQISEGDLRRAINLLQALLSTTATPSVEDVHHLAGYVSPSKVKEIIELVLRERDLKKGIEAIEYLLYEVGLSSTDLLKQMYREIIANSTIPPEKKLKIIETIADVDFRISEGASDDIQLAYLVSSLCST